MTAPQQPAATTENPWAIPPAGTEWGIPGHLNHPGFQTPAQPYVNTVQTGPRQGGSGFSIAGIVCGALALVFCPLGLGIAGLALASKAKSRGESLADVARIVSIVGLIGGILIGVLVATRM